MLTRLPLERFIDKVFAIDARELLAKMPDESVDAIIADPLYMVAHSKKRNCTYDWGPEPGTGKPEEFWEYHRDIYAACRRVLKPGGSFAWAMGCKFYPQFAEWFGGFRAWAFSRFLYRGQNAFGHIWLVQTKEQEPIRFPDADGLLMLQALYSDRNGHTRRHFHPCPKCPEEMEFMVRHLTKPGDIVLDTFAGTGTTLVAAKKLGRHWIGCDLSANYCRFAKLRLL